MASLGLGAFDEATGAASGFGPRFGKMGGHTSENG